MPAKRAEPLWPFSIAPAAVAQPPCGPTGLKTSILGACRQRLSSTMLTAVRGEPTAIQPAVLGLPQGEREGRTGQDRTGCPARPSGCRGSCEAAGPLRKGWRAAQHGHGCQHILCPTPARGAHRLLDTCGHHPQENCSWLRDAAQPRDAFCIVDGSCGTGGSCAKGERDCGYSRGSAAGRFPCGVCRHLQ